MSSHRRESFSATAEHDEGGLLELKKTVSQEAERRESLPGVTEAVPEHAVVSHMPSPIPETPSFEPSEMEQFIATRGEDATLMPMPTPAVESSSPYADDSGITTAAEEAALPPTAATKEDTTKEMNGLEASEYGQHNSDHHDTPNQITSPSGLTRPGAQQIATPARIHAQATPKPSPRTQANQRTPLSASKNQTPVTNGTSGKKTDSGKLVDRSRRAYSNFPEDAGSPAVDAPAIPTTQVRRGLSQLSAPTASSAARQEAPRQRVTSKDHASKTLSARQASGSGRSVPGSKPEKKVPAAKPGSQSGFSHLMAPTASSAARQDATKKDATAQQAALTTHRKVYNLSASGRNGDSNHTAALKTSVSGPGTERTSMSSSRSAGNGASRSEFPAENVRSHSRKVTPVGGSFLERMTRPTAATASKAHDKVEMHSPPHKAIARSASVRDKKLTGAGVKRAAARSSAVDSVSLGQTNGSGTGGESQYLMTASGNEGHQVPVTPTKTVRPSSAANTPRGFTTLKANISTEDEAVAGLSSMVETSTIH